ncbi:MAG: hypothetical protein R3C26_12575 [Calditrichia bacterium]
MQVMFIDIGFKQDAFLHFSDMGNRVGQLFADIDDDDLEDNGEVRNDADPQDLLRNGQEIIVQIVKEPIANKGLLCVSTEINLPGRFWLCCCQNCAKLAYREKYHQTRSENGSGI